MTKTQFKKKIASMKADINSYIDKETIRLFSSGGVDTTTYEDDYQLPKIILIVALENISRLYSPPSGGDATKEIKNLRKF